MHGLRPNNEKSGSFFDQNIIKECFDQSLNYRELLTALYSEWKKTENESIFLILYAQIWMCLEEIYMENSEKFYNDDIWEKAILFELLTYGDNNLNNSMKYLLLKGYMYSVMGYLLWSELGDQIEEEGKKILLELHFKYPQNFVVSCFYKQSFKNKIFIHNKKEKIKKIYELFPSDKEIDLYFREVIMKKFCCVFNG